MAMVLALRFIAVVVTLVGLGARLMHNCSPPPAVGLKKRRGVFSYGLGHLAVVSY